MPRDKRNLEPSRAVKLPDSPAEPFSESKDLQQEMVEILSGLSLTPVQLLELILKAVLGDKITKDEAWLISRTYYQTIMDWYP